MCTIFGYNNAQHIELNEIFFNEQRHRGPDFEDFHICDSWVLGHQRLSIIDTSSNANQPMSKNGHTIVLNGEIYNYIELKNTYLHDVIFHSTSDTEVLLELLQKYGLSILNKLNGMFAFAWYNQCSKELVLCRDRFGVKPLHWMENQGIFSFSSEIKPLLKIIKNIRFNDNIINTFFFDTATDFDQQTFVENVYQVKAGHFLLLKEGQEKIEKKWYKYDDYSFGKNIFNNYKQTVDLFEELLTDAIKIRHRSDVPICITLSGGLDSTTIYTLAKEHLKSSIQAFTFTHPGAKTNEHELASQLAATYNDNLITVSNHTENTIEELKSVLKALEFPIWNNSATAYSAMYKAIKSHGFTVVIEGHGSDEQLGGYPYMIEAATEQELYHINFFKAYDFQKIANKTHNPFLKQKGKEYSSFFHFLNTNAPSRIRHAIGNLIYNRKPLISKNYFQETIEDSFDYKIIPIVLRTFDRLSMLHAVESRSPFMDYRIVEFIRAMPLQYKLNKIGSKSILREILKKYKKDFIFKNTFKMGFAADVPQFYNKPENKEFLIGAVNRFNDTKYNYFKNNALESINKKYVDWTDTGNIWKIISLQMTKEMYGLQ